MNPVIGSEFGKIIILDQTGVSISKLLKIPSTSIAFIAAVGLSTQTYMIFVGARNSKIFLIQNGIVDFYA